MRRDVYIENDSGGFSVIAHDALAAIIEDQRSDDRRFVTAYKALLLELYGDDSLPVRIVVDEPLQPDEEQQWLARASWRIDSADGKLLVMGGFDPDVMEWWKDEGNGTADGRGVAVAEVPTGSLRVDIYAHTGSMNGRVILSAHHDSKPGAAFRASHPGRAFPLWLAKMLEFSGEEDPGHEDAWRNVKQSVESGALAIDLEGGAAIGFLVHVQRLTSPIGDPPDSGWFALDAGRRVPETFPIGLTSSVPDPDLEGFLDKILGRQKPVAPPEIVTRKVNVIDSWDGDALQLIRHNTPAIAVGLADAYWLHWMAALTADSPPTFEFWIWPEGEWQPPASTPEYAVDANPGAISAIGPSPDNGGWWLMWSARSVAAALAGVPDGSEIELATASRSSDDGNGAIGRARYRGVVREGRWALLEASPGIDRDTLTDALDFMHALTVNREIPFRNAAERKALEKTAAIYSPEEGSLEWKDAAVRVVDDDERTLLMLASPVFRTRFGQQWACDIEEEDDED